MPDIHFDSSEQKRAREVVQQLRARLVELGVPKDQANRVLPASDIQNRAYIRIGSLDLDSAEKVLAALTGVPA
jgi:hypothetical protein